MKIVINACYGGFCLSEAARAELRKRGQIRNERLPGRSNPILVQLIEEMGRAADGQCAELKIVEIPDGVDWEIVEYDGLESVHEKHRSWR